ncbi:hypothetical protein CVS47_01672 [Microbacterium lemovicicum]|uniref:Uncharacterized protein n=1 Tax=Microbacterium lemovicicum TaxID=1072463 RepID=A0A3Q9IYC1_9MICO|nr:hypothetical protein [Microbacterium lemovicicum]AZS37047.1 hypothetical protein CVS47_01672 [Microbacterium lemovicicum]
MHRTAHLAAAAVAVVLTLSLAGCAGDPSAAPTTSAQTVTPTKTPSPTPSPSATPTSTPTPTVVPANIPTSCDALGSGPERQEAVGDLRLQGDGVGFVRPAPEGATLALGCDWIIGDATGILVLLSTAPADAVTTAVGTLAGLGYQCQFSDDFGAQFCSKPGTSADTEEMIVARDDVWLYMSTSNRNGRGYLSNISTQLWG